MFEVISRRSSRFTASRFAASRFRLRSARRARDFARSCLRFFTTHFGEKAVSYTHL